MLGELTLEVVPGFDGCSLDELPNTKILNGFIFRFAKPSTSLSPSPIWRTDVKTSPSRK